MQGNLKQTVGVLDTQDFLPGAVDLRGGNLHLEWEALLLARLKEAVVTPALTQRRPVLTLASLLPVRAQQLISMHASAMQQQAIAPIHSVFMCACCKSCIVGGLQVSQICMCVSCTAFSDSKGCDSWSIAAALAFRPFSNQLPCLTIWHLWPDVVLQWAPGCMVCHARK